MSKSPSFMHQLRSFLFLLYSMLMLAALYLTLVVTSYDFNDIKALEDIVYCEWGFFRYDISLTNIGFRLFKIMLYLATLMICSLFLFVPFLQNVVREEWDMFLKESVFLLRFYREKFKALGIGQYVLIFGLIGALSAIRLYFLINYPLHTDETATYDYFVMEGIEAVTGFYPIPNNHVFQNFLNWLAYQIEPNFYFSVRGTSYIIGTLGLLVLLMLIYMAVNFRTAIIFTTLLGFSTMPFYFSITGRGYSLLVVLTGIGFITTYNILASKTNANRLNFVILTFSSIIGLYTVPTFLYTFATYVVILLVAFLSQRKYYNMIYVIGLCGVVGLTTVILYSPVLVITGPKALFSNTYLTPIGIEAVLSKLKEYFVSLESSLVGQIRWGYIASILVILTASVSVLKNTFSPDEKIIVIMALTGALLPYLFFVVQGVLPPERTLVYKAFYFCILVSVLVDTYIKYLMHNRNSAAILLSVLLILYSFYELSVSYRVMKKLQPKENELKLAWEKVNQTSPSSIYITDSDYQLFFLHYSKLSGNNISFYSDLEESQNYDFLITNRIQTLPESILCNYDIFFVNDNVSIHSRRR